MVCLGSKYSLAGEFTDRNRMDSRSGDTEMGMAAGAVCVVAIGLGKAYRSANTNIACEHCFVDHVVYGKKGGRPDHRPTRDN